MVCKADRLEGMSGPNCFSTCEEDRRKMPACLAGGGFAEGRLCGGIQLHADVVRVRSPRRLLQVADVHAATSRDGIKAGNLERVWPQGYNEASYPRRNSDKKGQGQSWSQGHDRQ